MIQHNLPKPAQWILSAALVITLLFTSTQPAHAWWFLPKSETRTVTPVHQNTSNLPRFWKQLLPQFILEPLTDQSIESPPTVKKEVKKTNPAKSQPDHPHKNLKTTNYSATAKQMLAAVNKVRQDHHLAPLTLNQQLINSAQKYATLLQSQDWFSHTSPNGQSFRERNEAAGYTNWRWMGENIAKGQQNIDEAMHDWMNSPTHRANILHPQARELGVGYASGRPNYWVQEFGLQF